MNAYETQVWEILRGSQRNKCEDMDRKILAEGREKWLDLVNTVSDVQTSQVAVTVLTR